MYENNRKLRKINDYMTDRILNEIDDSICNGNRENRLSNNINVSFGNIDGKALLVLLDMEGQVHRRATEVKKNHMCFLLLEFPKNMQKEQ